MDIYLDKPIYRLIFPILGFVGAIPGIPDFTTSLPKEINDWTCDLDSESYRVATSQPKTNVEDAERAFDPFLKGLATHLQNECAEEIQNKNVTLQYSELSAGR